MDFSEGEEEQEVPTQGNAKRELKLKRLQTFCYCVVYLNIGLSVGIIGPALKFLARQTTSSVDSLGTLFIVRGVGWCISSLFSGKVLEHEKVRSRALVFVVGAVQGLSMSGIDVVNNTLVVVVWKEKVGPYMQLIHFAFGLGAAIAPAIVALCLSIFDNADSAVSASFYVCGVLVLISCFAPYFIPSPALEVKNDTKAIRSCADLQAHLSKNTRRLLIFIGTAGFLCFYVGLETSWGAFIYSFARDSHQSSAEAASALSSVVWIGMTVGRLIGVGIANLLSEIKILCYTVSLSIISLVILLIFNTEAVMWVVTAVSGVILGPVFAAGCMFVSRYSRQFRLFACIQTLSLPAKLGEEISGVMASVMIVGSSVGDMLPPFIVGICYTTYGPNSLFYVILACWLLCLLFFVAVLLVARIFKRAEAEVQLDEQALIQHEAVEEQGTVIEDIRRVVNVEDFDTSLSSDLE